MMSVAIEKPKVKRKASTEAARQMFLYGEGDGVRIVDVQELAKKTGASDQTIRMRIPEWQAELENILVGTSKLGSPNILSLPNETLEKHREDVEFFRARLDKAKTELTALPSIISELKDLVHQFASDESKFDEALALMDRTLRLWANEKSLTKLVIDLKTIHDSKCGLDSLKSIQEATAKSASIAALKATPEEVKENGVVPVGSGVFQRSKNG